MVSCGGLNVKTKPQTRKDVFCSRQINDFGGGGHEIVNAILLFNIIH